MNKKAPKVLDKIQIVLIAGLAVSQVVQFFFNALESLYLTNHYEEFMNGTLEMPLNLTLPYTIFLFLSISFGTWMVVRFITYKKRKEDYLLEQNQE